MFLDLRKRRQGADAEDDAKLVELRDWVLRPGDEGAVVFVNGC